MTYEDLVRTLRGFLEDRGLDFETTGHIAERVLTTLDVELEAVGLDARFAPTRKDPIR